LVQSFTACMPLLTAISALGLWRCWSSPQQWHLHCLCTFDLIKNMLYDNTQPYDWCDASQNCKFSVSLLHNYTNYSALRRGAVYFNECICLSVCPLAYLWCHTHLLVNSVLSVSVTCPGCISESKQIYKNTGSLPGTHSVLDQWRKIGREAADL